MTVERHWAMLRRLPWRIAVEQVRPAAYRSATPTLCLPQVTPTVRERLQRQGHEVWRFEFLGSGASDRCLGSEPDRLRQIATVVGLILNATGAPRVTIAAQESEAGLAEAFAAAYPFAFERLVTSLEEEQDESVQRHRRDLRSSAA